MQPQGAAGTITAHRTLQRAALHWGEGLGLASRPSRPLIGWRLLWEKEATLAVHASGTSQRAASPHQPHPGQGAHFGASAQHPAVFLTVRAADSCITNLPCWGPGIISSDLGDFKVPESLKQLFCPISLPPFQPDVYERIN